MKKLFIDYDRCNACEEECSAGCSYTMHPDNNGVTCLRELASFMVVCRKCEDFPCVNACPNQALKRHENLVRRSRFMCISCKTCAMACPFGTILPELIPYLVSACDGCLGRLAETAAPECVASCPSGAVRYIDELAVSGEKHVYACGDRMLVKAVNWLKNQELTK